MQHEHHRREFLKKSGLLGAATLAAPQLLQGSPISSETKTIKGTAPKAPRKLCLFSKHLQWLDYYESAQLMAEAGFDGVDLTVRKGGHVTPERVEEDLPKAVEEIERAGLKVYLMTTNLKNATDANAEATLKTASELGIKQYRMAYYRYDWEKGVAATLPDIQSQFSELADLNRQYGMHGAYQNHAGDWFGAPIWDIWNVLKDLDPQYAGCQYDVRHAVAEGGRSWKLGLDLIAPWVSTTVIKDFHWMQREDGSWRAGSVPLGEGMVNFEKYWDLVEQKGISGPISLHYEFPLTQEKAKTLSKKERWRQSVQTLSRDLNKLKGMLKARGLE